MSINKNIVSIKLIKFLEDEKFLNYKVLLKKIIASIFILIMSILFMIIYAQYSKINFLVIFKI